MVTPSSLRLSVIFSIDLFCVYMQLTPTHCIVLRLCPSCNTNPCVLASGFTGALQCSTVTLLKCKIYRFWNFNNGEEIDPTCHFVNELVKKRNISCMVLKPILNFSFKPLAIFVINNSDDSQLCSYIDAVLLWLCFIPRVDSSAVPVQLPV